MQASERADLGLVPLVMKAARSVTAQVEPVLKAEGLTVDQWLILDALAGSPNATMTELANATLIAGPTLTRAADRLVTTAVAFREVDAHDRRKVRVYLSPRGRAAHRRVSRALAELEERLLAEATADPGEPEAGEGGAPLHAAADLLAALRRIGR